METSSEDEEEEEEESPFLGRAMLEGLEQAAHLSGEGVRQRFFRTRVIPSLDDDEEEEEDIILGRSSTTSLLDSILSTIDFSGLSQPVSFPELGRDLIPFWQDAFDPVTNVRLTSESWFDNWVVEGVDRLADIDDVEVEVGAKSRVIPEVVPFLVPEAHDQQIVVIGGREV